MSRAHANVGRGTAVLSGDVDADSGAFTIHGVAIGSDDVTVGSSGVRKVWPGEELEEAAESLVGKPLVKDHENSVDGVIGRVTKATYRHGTGVLYEAEISEQFADVAQKIADGLLEVSVRAYHAKTEELDEHDELDAKIVEDVVFDNLAVVPQGAAPSNSAEFGKASVLESDRPNLSSAELSEALESDDVYEADERLDTDDDEDSDEELINPPTWDEGDIVKWQSTPEKFGKIVHVDDEKDIVMVEVHENVDGELQSTGFTDTAGYSDIVEVDTEDMESDNDGDGDELETHPSMHTPDWSGLDDSREWSKPAKSDFDTSDMSEIDDHFIISKTGDFPPENYGDLALPVVWPNGDLSLDGLDSAHQTAGQVDGVSDDMADDIQSKINSWADEHFDQPVADEEMSDDATDSDEQDTEETVLRFARIDDDSSSADKMGTSDSGHNDNYLSMEINTRTVDSDELSEEHVAVDEAELDRLVDKAERADELDSRLDEMGDTLETLSKQTEKLDDVSDDDLDELRDADDPVVVEQETYDAKMEQVDDVGSIFAELLEDAGSPFDAEELTERFSPLELKAKYEEEYVDDEDGSLVDQLSAGDPEPEGDDVDDDELGDDPEDDDGIDREEAREALAQKFESEGYTKQAEEARQGEIPVDEYIDLE